MVFGKQVSFDVLAVNYSMLKEYGVKLKGVILNKVLPHTPHGGLGPFHQRRFRCLKLLRET